MVSVISRAARWNQLISPLGVKPSLKNSTLAVIIGYFASLAIPRIGEITRCWSLNKTDNISTSELFGTVVVERAIDLIVLLLITLVFVLLQFEVLGSFFIDDLLFPLFNKLSLFFSENYMLLILLLIIFCIIILIIYKKREAIFDSGIIAKLRKIGTGLIEGIGTVRRLQNPLLFVTHTVIIWLTIIISFYISFNALTSTQHLTFNNATFVFILSGISWAAPLQAGVGAFHWLVSNGLSLYEVTVSDGLVFATITNAASILLFLVMGCISLLYVTILSNKS